MKAQTHTDPTKKEKQSKASNAKNMAMTTKREQYYYQKDRGDISTEATDETAIKARTTTAHHSRRKSEQGAKLATNTNSRRDPSKTDPRQPAQMKQTHR